MLRLIPASEGPLRKALTICVLCYDDPRTADFMVEAFPRAQDAETVLHLGERLAHKGVEFFRPFLWQRKTAQALAAARVCRQAGGLEPRDLLRVAILLEGDNPLPPLGEVWRDELTGPHRAKARQLAETLGEQVLGLWSAPLPAAETHWLLQLTLRHDPERARQEVERLLDEGLATLPLVEMALELGVKLPASLLSQADPEVRAAAIRVGLADGCLEHTAVAGCEQVILCGTEAHVCVQQTALDLRAAGKQVFIVAEAAGSRAPANRDLAFERMRGHGIEIVSREMVAFEWLQRGGTELFREVNRDFIR